jgi:hypothetical protein
MTMSTPHELLRTLCATGSLGLACILADPVAAQDVTAGPLIDRGAWEFAMQVGLTDFGVDRSAPGSMTTVGIARNLTSRWSIGVEGGLDSIETVGICELGVIGRFECAHSSTWPAIGFDTRFTFLSIANSAGRHYFLVQFVGHGPDLVASYDLGLGTSVRTVLGGDVGIELRHRFGYDGASGFMYFFRVSR